MYMVTGVRYDWDEHNRGYVAAHQVEPPEVEEVLANDPIHIETWMDTRSGEERFSNRDIAMPDAFCSWHGRLAANSDAP
jgi:hypothetical protein